MTRVLAKHFPKPVVVDVETTGLGAHDRLVEVAVITLDPETWETQDEYDTLIGHGGAPIWKCSPGRMDGYRSGA